MTTTSDKELLELAAKAAGIKGRMVGWTGEEWFERTDVTGYLEGYKPRIEWNPLTDDGNALRLAVKLKLDIWRGKHPSGEQYVAAQKIWHSNDSMYYDDGVVCGDDPYVATRRAIVRAAAEIGKTL